MAFGVPSPSAGDKTITISERPTAASRGGGVRRGGVCRKRPRKYRRTGREQRRRRAKIRFNIYPSNSYAGARWRDGNVHSNPGRTKTTLLAAIRGPSPPVFVYASLAPPWSVISFGYITKQRRKRGPGNATGVQTADGSRPAY